jgi:hypothetical protein
MPPPDRPRRTQPSSPWADTASASSRRSGLSLLGHGRHGLLSCGSSNDATLQLMDCLRLYGDVARDRLDRRGPIRKQKSRFPRPFAIWSEARAGFDAVPMTILTSSSTEVRGLCSLCSAPTFWAVKGPNNPTGRMRVFSLAYVA